MSKLIPLIAPNLLLLVWLLLGNIPNAFAQTDRTQPDNRAMQWYQEGLDLIHKGDYASALSKLEAGQKTAELSGDQRLVTKIWLEIGRANRLLGDFPKAVEYYQNALKKAEELGDKQDVSITLNNIGLEYEKQGSYSEAIKVYQKALALMEELGYKRGHAATLNNLGVVYWNEGSYGSAILYFQQALKIGEALEDKQIIAMTLNNMGGVYRQYGSYESAIDAYQAARRIREELGDKPGIANNLNNMGVVYSDQGLFDRAAEYYERALKVKEEAGDKKGIANTLNNIGILHMDHGFYGRALEYYQKALRMRDEVGDKLGRAVTLNNLGIAYRKQGAFAKALEYHQSALSVSREIQAKSPAGRAYTGMARAHLGQEHYAEAVTAAQPSLTLGKETNEPRIIWDAYDILGLAYEKLGDPLKALSHYQLAVVEIEKVRVHAVSDEGKAGFFAEHLYVYEHIIRLLHKLSKENPAAIYERQAFEYAERAKARAMLDALAEGRAAIRKGLSSEQLDNERAIFRKISQIQSELRKERLSEAKRTAWMTKLKQAEEELDKFVEDLRSHCPEYAQLQYPEPFGSARVQKELDENSLLVEFFLGDEQSFVFAMGRTDMQMAALPKRGEIERRVNAYLQTIRRFPKQAMGSESVKRMEEHYQGARALFDQLLGPIQERIRGKATLILVPDGALHYLPFETLLVTRPVGSRKGPSTPRRGKYLLEEYLITYAPSASVWGNLKTGKNAVVTGQKDLLAFADPVIRRGQRAGGRPSPRRGERAGEEGVQGPFNGAEFQFAPLPYTRQEVEALSHLFRKDQQRIYVGAKASEETLKRERLDEYRRIHFATHAVIDEQAPRRSGLILSWSGGKEEEDGILQVSEIFNLELAAELVVLSACESGLGKLIRGEGMLGLTRAFLYAGAQNLVVSLWNVNDRSTAQLMQSFYRYMRAGRNRAYALRQAKLDLLHSSVPGYAFPYFWAPFILIGQTEGR
ncbi:MAG: CHAT domain-containing protein [Acidobacteria bacterium]|nr:CHAT domain-containing protein [Acidobacteriota bacterium]MBI3657661.1 CHAT domain-containing protein [Acidobacteriota bacterium]